MERILSAEDIAAVKVAVEICCNPEVKREILSLRGDIIPHDSYKRFHEKELRWREKELNISYNSDPNEYRLRWVKEVAKKAIIIVETLSLPEKLKKKVENIVLSVGQRMLTWAVYHERTVGFSREYSINFLNNSFFTTQGIIDNKKAAEELMKDESLSIRQKYNLACLYCFTDHISTQFKQIRKEDKQIFYSTDGTQWIKQPIIVKFWSYYLMGEVDKAKGEKSLDKYRLEKAIESGSKAAVEYCLEKTNLRRETDTIVVDAALEAVRQLEKSENNETRFVFMHERIKENEEELWTPSDYYVDVLLFLLSKMREDQKIEFFKKDIEDVEVLSERLVVGDGLVRDGFQLLEKDNYSRVLKCLLKWPYEYYFMKTAGLMWEFLPAVNYADLLLQICDKIEQKFYISYLHIYWKESSYDYRGLLKDFWHQSPEHYKRYVLSNQEGVRYVLSNQKGVRYKDYDADNLLLNIGAMLIRQLFTLFSFSNADTENIALILESATDEEKENIISSKKGKNIPVKLMKREKWKVLNEFLLHFFPSKEQADEFKRELSFKKEAQRVCLDFIYRDKWNSAELFIKWTSLPEKDINQLKKEMIYSEQGKRACRDLFYIQCAVEIANKFCDWSFSSKDEVRKFREELIFSTIGVEGCAFWVMKNELKLVDEFTSWCLSSQEKIKEFKEDLAYRAGVFICGNLISDYLKRDVYDYSSDYRHYISNKIILFEGGKWEQVEKFLTWCFESEKEIHDFKKNKLLEKSAVKIHFNLVKSNHFEEAQTFFSWLGLSDKEIKALKKETIFYHGTVSYMFSKLMRNEGDYSEFNAYSEEIVPNESFGYYKAYYPDIIAVPKEFVNFICAGDDVKSVIQECVKNDNESDEICKEYMYESEETIETLLRWCLTDKETVLEFNNKFRRGYENVNEETENVLEIFDLMIEKILRDLDTE